MPSPLLDLFVANLDRDAPFLVARDGSVTTYAAFGARVRHLAGALAARGVAVGDRVSVQVDKHPDVVTLYLASLWVGAVFHPMNPAYAPDEADYLLGDAEPTLQVRTADALAALVAEASEAEPVDQPAPRADGDVAALLYTSGTTGRPKGAMITHGNLASNAAALRTIWGFGPNDVLLHVLPVSHAHGLFVACNTSMANGTPIVWHDRFDVDATIDALSGQAGQPVRPTVLMGVPTHYTRLLASPRFDRGASAEVRLFISGSAPLQATTHAEFEARTGQRILERYGMTETQMICSNPLDGERVAGTVGYPLPNVEVRVVGDDGAPLAVGVPGEVEVRGPNVFAGYWRQPERRATDFSADGWFRTGDVGSLAADGRLTLVGRSKDLIILGGYNVYPAELERLLDSMEGVAESAVIGMPHPDFGECGLAVLAAAPGAGPGAPELDELACLHALRSRVARYKVPRHAVVVDALPRNAMGKVQKQELRDRFAPLWAALLAADK